MIEHFKLWSDISPTSKSHLKPTLELRSWDDLSDVEKQKFIRHLWSKGWLEDGKDYVDIASELNNTYKVSTFAENYFKHGGPHSSYGSLDDCCISAASKDLIDIFKTGSQDLVFEVFSLYARGLIKSYYLKNEPSDDDILNAYDEFDSFVIAINDIFDHFALNTIFTRVGLAPKQEDLVNEYVLDPLIRSLPGRKWEPVQSEIKDGLTAYHKGTKESYSTAITHLSSALQAYLQILVNGSIGKGDVDDLIRTGLKNGQIPNDEFSKKVISGLKSTVMEYRQKNGDAHPKRDYANERSTRLVLNVVAVFIQHCATHS